MNFRNVTLAAAVAAVLGMAPQAGLAQQATEYGQIKWFGSVYGKFLDGNRRYEGGLFSNAESTPGFAGGDQGQGMELELMMSSQLSKQVEFGARIHSRFYGNYWSNFGGFGPAEDNMKTNQYFKLRGAWVRLTPGYDWVDSVTIGNSDFGMFDPWTQGKYRYIDRDNAGGFLFQGTAMDRKLRWDVARVTLASYFQGVGFNTGDIVANDANYVGQVKFTPSPDWNATLIGMYARDKEIDEDDNNPLNGFGTSTRFDNSVLGLRAQFSGLGFVDIRGSVYHSELNVEDGVCNSDDLNNSCRFSPLLKEDASDEAWTLNLDFNRVFMDGLSLNVQLFDIGADYQSITAARREADVLLTEGPEGSWQWSLPDYNTGSRTAPGTFGVGYGGWNGEVQQVVSLMADNDFADFDESYVHSVIGWKGVTLVPKLLLGDWEFAGEYSWIDFNTNWQACGGQDKDVGCIYPRNEGLHSWGLGGDFRSPYAPYQDRQMEIFALKAKYTLDFGNGVDLMARYKYVSDEDDRVTRASLLTDAYDGYPGATGSINPDWIPNIGLGGCLECDDRKADYDTIAFSAGYQLTPDLYARMIYELQQVELIDGTIDVAPVGLAFEGAPGSYAEYLTGEHTKNRLGLEFTYFLSGVNFGGSIDYFWGEYDPEFYTDLGGERVKLLPAPGIDSFATALGNISTRNYDLGQYRMKIWMKVGF